jgi:chloramphenicol-sensitive protein RarD
MQTEKEQAKGIWYGVSAYAAWGVLPLYWKLLQAVPAQEILAHRILWSFIFVSALLAFNGGLRPVLQVFRNKRDFFLICVSGCLISLNWFTYIWAVNSGQVIEASMGYYINPLVVVLLGVCVLKERLTRWQTLAIALAAAGVMMITVQYGRVPFVALILAFTFALYGLAKKLIQVDSLTGLALETMIVMPVALIYILTREIQGVGALGLVSPATAMILLGSGIATATPLLLFAKGVRLIRFSTVGFLQYLAPTLSLILGVFVFKESFSAGHMLSFGFIWAGLLIFLLSNIGLIREPAPVMLPVVAEAALPAEQDHL